MPPYVPPPVPMPATALVPTAAQRLGLAIASLALFIPLLAIAISIAQPLATVIPGWLSLLAALMSVTIVSLTVVAVNVIFNLDALRRRR